MSRTKAAVLGLCALVIAIGPALAFESVYRITIRPRVYEPHAPVGGAKAASTASDGQPAFAMRLVDSGGVGIPLDADWGRSYSHDRRSFRDVIREDAPYVDADAFERMALDWRAYVERMIAYGNNAIAVPMFLELINFDRLGGNGFGEGMLYGPSSPFRLRHSEVRRQFGPLFEWTNKRGMDVLLDTDMLALTTPLAQRLRRVAPAANASGIDTRNPAVWDVYRAGLEELFDALPFIKGVVIRFGEGGSLYNTGGWPYESQMAVRDADSLRAMLRGLLSAFEARGKTLVLRSWTVGLGRIGRLHVDPDLYERVLDDIRSPALIVSTKFTAGDFFSYLPLNATLEGGPQRRIVELQAKPEFEGFGAFPDFLGADHARALRALSSANPNIAGTYLLTQFGGPLRAGPRMLYPLHGFWLWTDANVFVASQLALDRRRDVDELAREWAAARFGPDARIVDAVTSLLRETRTAVLKGFYIPSFAEREVRVPGLELPPLMWIFEWDMVGGWHSLLSIVYHGTSDSVDRAIADGHEAAAIVRRARQRLQTAVEAAAPDACADCGAALRSLEYQETLFDALAAWRQAFLSYYQWLDTGDPNAWAKWQEGRSEFETTAARHIARFGRDLEFPAFDLTSAQQAVVAAERAAAARRIAVGLVLVIGATLCCGSPWGRRWGRLAAFPRFGRFARLVWTGAITPWRLGNEAVDFGSSAAVAIFALGAVGVLVAMLTGFTAIWLGAAFPLVVAIVALAFQSTAIGSATRPARGRLLIAFLGSLVPGLMAMFVIVAYLGTVGFWYSFWTSRVLRVVFLTILFSTLLWTVYAILAARAVDGWRGAVGGALAAAGAGLVTLTLLLPDSAAVLRFLDRPLNFAPATDTMVFALRTYGGVSLDIGWRALVLGLVMLAGGYALWLRSIVRTR